MKCWKESQEEVRKVRPDKEMAKSLLKMIEVRTKMIRTLNNDQFVSIKIENYYEIIKEAITALMSIDGYKTLSHEILIGYLHEFYKDFSKHEINLIDQVRQIRNKIVYRGFLLKEIILTGMEKI